MLKLKSRIMLLKRIVAVFAGLLCSISMISCSNDTYEEVQHYKIANVNHYVNLREKPTTSSKVLAQIPLGQEIHLIDSRNSPWLYVETTGYKRGWIHRNYVVSWTERVKIQPLPMSAKLKKTGQKHTYQYFAFVEQLRDKYDTKQNRTWLITISVLLGVILSLLIGMCERFHWWQYFLMLAFIGFEFMGFVVCDIFGSEGTGFDVFLIDLVVFILICMLPSAQWYSTKALLSNTLESVFRSGTAVGFVEVHMVLSFILILPAVVCIYKFPAYADTALLAYAGFQALLLIVLGIISICRGAILGFIFYSVLFFLFLLPFVFSVLTVLALQFSLMITILLFISPLFSGTATEKIIELQDSSGRLVDKIDSSGWSLDSGNHYTYMGGGFWRKHF